jgi:SAM-dependent methyltransferase
MHMDVVELRDFYRTRLGQTAQRLIRRRLRDIWPDIRGHSLLGLGYAVPFLRPFMEEAERVVAFMPAGQGVMPWPVRAPGLTALVDETDLPLQDASVSRVLLVHAVENSESYRRMLQEAWRVLDGSGRLIVVAPNRSGVWARTDRTPFGHGHPFSRSQLNRLLNETCFVPEVHHKALFVPPLRWNFLLTAAPAWERVGDRWLNTFGGVILIEASKRLYRPIRTGETKRSAAPVRLPAAQTAFANGHETDEGR